MNPRPADSPPQRGFTLIELMLAVTILGLVLAMLAESFNVVAHSKVHGEARLSVDRAGRAILWQLSNDFRGMVQTPNAPSNVVVMGAGRAGESGPADTATISTLNVGHSRAIFGFGPENIVSYNLVRNPDQRGWYLLTRSQQSGLMGSDSQAGPAAVLADNVLSLHLRYYDGSKWTESWDSTSLQRGSQVPIAVVIELQMAAPNGHVLNFATQVTVPMAIREW